MTILVWIKELFGPVADLVDNVYTSEEERLLARAKLQEAQNAITSRLVELESQLIGAQSRVVIAEAQGASWLQRNWRPLPMLVIIAIVANNYLIFPYLSLWTDKVTVLELPTPLFVLMTTGVGGYVVGRSVEKSSLGANVIARFTGRKNG